MSAVRAARRRAARVHGSEKIRREGDGADAADEVCHGVLECGQAGRDDDGTEKAAVEGEGAAIAIRGALAAQDIGVVVKQGVDDCGQHTECHGSVVTEVHRGRLEDGRGHVKRAGKNTEKFQALARWQQMEHMRQQA